MRGLRIGLIGAVVSLAAACSSTSGGGPSPPSTSQLGQQPDDIVCKRVNATGTRFSERKCLTVAQWEALQRGAEQAVDEIQRRASHQQDMPGQGN